MSRTTSKLPTRWRSPSDISTRGPTPSTRSREVLRRKPNFGRAHQEVGYNHIAMQNFAACRHCIRARDQQRPVAGQQLEVSGEVVPGQRQPPNGSPSLRDQLVFLESLPTSNSWRSSATCPTTALATPSGLCKHFLRDNKTHVRGHATPCRDRHTEQDLRRGGIPARELHRVPSRTSSNARIQYVNILMRVQKFAKAFEEAQRLLDDYPDDTEHILSLYASASRRGRPKRPEPSTATND